MLTIRPAAARGHSNFGWLDSRHSFSFGEYYDPAQMGFRDLRVINDDRISGGSGFDTHSHRDMEIITLVLEGALEHRDSMGNHTLIRAGEVQRMSAGTGVRHSEYNASATAPAHFLQMWVLPDKQGHTPGYAQQDFGAGTAGITHLLSRDGAHGALTLNQDIRLLRVGVTPAAPQTHKLAAGRHAWVQALSALAVNGQSLQAGDGVAVSDERELRLTQTGAELGKALIFDLA